MRRFDKINLYENGKPLGVLLAFQEVCSVATSFEDMASKISIFKYYVCDTAIATRFEKSCLLLILQAKMKLSYLPVLDCSHPNLAV